MPVNSQVVHPFEQTFVRIDRIVHVIREAFRQWHRRLTVKLLQYIYFIIDKNLAEFRACRRLYKPQDVDRTYRSICPRLPLLLFCTRSLDCIDTVAAKKTTGDD